MNQSGSLGEAYAARLLEQKGYRILARNFRIRLGELDLVAQKGEILAFVEVKTRAANSLTRPCAAVTIAKQRKLILTAQAYLSRYPADLQPRFDVIEIVTETAPPFRVREALHIENAFFVTGENSR